MLSKDPPSFMTLFEDSVALLGVLIAAAATYAAVALGHPEFDGMGSIAIGLILAGTSLFLARESKSLLIGEPAYPVGSRFDSGARECPTQLPEGQRPHHHAGGAQPGRGHAQSRVFG